MKKVKTLRERFKKRLIKKIEGNKLHFEIVPWDHEPTDAELQEQKQIVDEGLLFLLNRMGIKDPLLN